MSSAEEMPFTREDRYSSVLANQPASGTLRAIYEEVYGADYPAEAEPLGFVTVTDLGLIRHLLAEAEVTRLLDVGCGRGGPGLWLARELGIPLVGVDIIPAAVTAARQRATDFGMAKLAQFLVASATDTRLPAAGFDGAISIDALWMVVDKLAAFRELGRVLRPGGVLAVTTWEPAHLDYSWYLKPAGFTDIRKQQILGSAERQNAVYEAILRHRDEITEEFGAAGAEVLIAEATETPAMLDKAPRIIITAVRR